MRSKQIAERVRVEEAHKAEFMQFTAEWDRRMKLFDEKVPQLYIQSTFSEHSVNIQ
jgi:uncharacterized lipoprotein YddW (UPF0748 family)